MTFKAKPMVLLVISGFRLGLLSKVIDRRVEI